MNPLDFLNLADRLKTSPDEAELRTSISRSYYATYNFLRQSLWVHGVPFGGTGEDHLRLVHYLSQSGDIRTKKLGGKLRGLRASRGDADYDLARVVRSKDSQFAFSTADTVIKDFSTIPPLDLQGIIGAIKSLPPYTPPWKQAKP